MKERTGILGLFALLVLLAPANSAGRLTGGGEVSGAGCDGPASACEIVTRAAKPELAGTKPELAGSKRGPAQPGSLLWEDRFDASPFEQAFMATTLRGRVFAVGYVSGRDWIVRAYDDATGALLWQDRFDRGGDDFASGVATDGKRLYVSGTSTTPGRQYDWVLRAYDPETGRLLWQDVFDLAARSDFSRGTAMTTGGGLVFLGGYGTTPLGDTDWIIRAYDAKTGALRWQDRRDAGGDDGIRELAYDDGRLFAGGWGNTAAADRAVVRGYDAAAGTLVWEHATSGLPGFGGTFTIALDAKDGRVVVGQQVVVAEPFKVVPRVRAYAAATGAVLWEDRIEAGGERDWLEDLDISGGRVFTTGEGGPACRWDSTGNCDAHVRSYSLQSGELRWARLLDLSGVDDVAKVVTADRGRAFVFSQFEATQQVPGCCVMGRWLVQSFDVSSGRLLWQSFGGELDSAVYNMVVDRGRLFVPGRSIDPETGRWDFIVRAYDARGRTGQGEPLGFWAPKRFTLSGASGTASFDMSYDPDDIVTTAVQGLVPAATEAGNVVDDPADDIGEALSTGVGVAFHTVSVPAGTRNMRVSLFDEETDGINDLDLYVVGPTGEFVGSSGGVTSTEAVDLASPAPGDYTVIVHGYRTDGADANYTLFSWSLGETAAGNITVSGPSPATDGWGAVTLDWVGLTAGTRYLGSVTYSNGATELGETLIAARG